MEALPLIKESISHFKVPHVIVVGGPAGCGKTTIGSKLANLLDTTFIEGDGLHSQHNIDKMSDGIPLTDEDREPWLRQISETSTKISIENNNLSVVSCSMLKKKYRDLLKLQSPNTKFVFVFIWTTFEELVQRVKNRQNHYMKNDMVKSQYDIMEIPNLEEGIAIEVFDMNELDVFDVVLHRLSLYFQPTV